MFGLGLGLRLRDTKHIHEGASDGYSSFFCTWVRDRVRVVGLE